MGMPLLQFATSVLRETWGFDLVPVRQLVVHCVETILIVIGCVSSLPDFDRSCSLWRFTPGLSETGSSAMVATEMLCLRCSRCDESMMREFNSAGDWMLEQLALKR